MKIPGVVWSALLIILPMLSVWLVQFFPAAVWTAPVAGLLLIIVKTIEILGQRKVDEETHQEVAQEAAPKPVPSLKRQWLVG